MIKDGELGGVEPAERDGTERDGPDIGGDLFESDVLATEEMRDVDPGGVPSNATVGGDLSDFEVSWVLRGDELGRKGPSGGLIDRSGGLVVESLVGSDLVEVDPPGVEAPLLMSRPWTLPVRSTR